jgi:hypothetical protein
MLNSYFRKKPRNLIRQEMHLGSFCLSRKMWFIIDYQKRSELKHEILIFSFYDFIGLDSSFKIISTENYSILVWLQLIIPYDVSI